MKKNILILFALLITLLTFHSSVYSQSESNNDSGENKSSDFDRNFIKVNLTALPLKNFGLQYERVMTKHISLGLSVRYMPNTTLPFKNLILNSIEDGDTDTEDVINRFKLSNFAITPEVRFYLSKKGYGRGFYIAPFYRYANFKSDNLEVDYESDFNGEGTLNMKGKLSAHTGGFAIGAQWLLGKNLCLDWTIFGPQFGSGKGEFIGVSSVPLSQTEQEDLRQELEDLDIPLTDKTIYVDSNGASLKLDGPWAGVRFSISLGIKF